MTLYRRSGMDQVLEHSLLIQGEQHYLYGDPAYELRPWLQKGFTGAVLGAEEAAFNREMSSLRESVEWGFKDIKQLFSTNDYSREMRPLKSPVGPMVVVSSALASIRCSLYQSQTGRYFDCPASSLCEYLRFEAEGEEEQELL